ncbi:5328_t:CDS:2 [Paraglomus brasilianum]|uniref:5328_t:CDS:1 n=1 Tax=Paraglomus brasilianum TaxID=144538 RepID=A0A9N9B465_9GLOM|nr:5328_t:CDS:2 [Paraglomus brasilianum]
MQTTVAPVVEARPLSEIQALMKKEEEPFWKFAHFKKQDLESKYPTSLAAVPSRYKGFVIPVVPDIPPPEYVDLTLGNEFRYFVHQNEAVPISNEAGPKDYQNFSTILKLDDDKPYYLGPGQMCLGITRERVKLPSGLCALIEGRSRFARLGLSVHITASFINPGVDNQTVLEIFNASSLTLALHPGTKVCQMIFMTMEGEASYSGIFQGQAL